MRSILSKQCRGCRQLLDELSGDLVEALRCIRAMKHLFQRLIIDKTSGVLGDIQLALLQVLSELPVTGEVVSGTKIVICLLRTGHWTDKVESVANERAATYILAER